MFPVSRTNNQRVESVIQDTWGNNVENVGGENLSRNDILYNLVKQFASKCARELRNACKEIIVLE